MGTTRKPERKVRAKPGAKRSTTDRGDSSGTTSGTKEQTIPILKAAGSDLIQAVPVEDVKGFELQRPVEAARPTIRELAVEFLKHPDEWLDHPNPQFGGRTPNEVIAAGEEDRVRNLFFCYEHGLF